MSLNPNKEFTDAQKDKNPKNETLNQQLGLRKRWLDLLSGILNVDNDFEQVAICELTTGKVWAEIGEFKLNEPNYRANDHRMHEKKQGERIPNQSCRKKQMEDSDHDQQSSESSHDESYESFSEDQKDEIDEELILTSSNLSSLRHFEGQNSIRPNEQLQTRNQRNSRSELKQ
jgi:hypothetical protein